MPPVTINLHKSLVERIPAYTPHSVPALLTAWSLFLCTADRRTGWGVWSFSVRIGDSCSFMFNQGVWLLRLKNAWCWLVMVTDGKCSVIQLIHRRWYSLWYIMYRSDMLSYGWGCVLASSMHNFLNFWHYSYCITITISSCKFVHAIAR